MRRDTLLGTVAVTVALVGCGGAGGSSSTPQASAAPNTTRSFTAAESSPTATAGTEAGTAAIPASSVTTPGASSTTADTAPRLPARFTVGTGGRLSPSLVAAPAHIDIEVSVRCTDRHGHRVVLVTPHRHTFQVSRSSAADVLLVGLRIGTYAIKVDGKPRGKLIVGAVPGP